MSELDEASHVAASATAPRWKRSQSLELVRQLNERCIELLCDVAASNSPDTTLQLVMQQRELWVRLKPEARQLLAQLPFVIVDAQFKNEAWWRRVADSNAIECEVETSSNGLPPEASEHLMHETLMFAWQTARWDRSVALMSFGILPSVAEVIALLTPRQIRAIAVRERHCVQVRWTHNPQLWRDLLLAANDGDEEKLTELRLHGKLLFCSELVQFRR